MCVSEFEVHVARVDCDDVLCDQLAMEKDGGASPHQVKQMRLNATRTQYEFINFIRSNISSISF